ncbi:Type III restriction enzyme, res subunit [Bacteroidales bacterium Barb6]|nr:Type III restriction enzyme, res subunit [Bacteroidales bacterium Barb6]
MTNCLFNTTVLPTVTVQPSLYIRGMVWTVRERRKTVKHTNMTLRTYQETISNAAESLRTCYTAYLAMEVRTGKTFTALAAVGKYEAASVLFVTKKNALPSIEADYGTLSPAYALTAVNFESLHKVTGTYDLVIIDEAHSVGAAFPKPSKKAQELKRICQGLPIVYLSGTPSPESYSQMYHQLYASSRSP